MKRRYYSYLRSDLINTLEWLGISDCLLITHGSLGVVREKVDCDFFFGEVTLGSLLE